MNQERRGREAAAFRDVRAVGFRASGFRPCAKDCLPRDPAGWKEPRRDPIPAVDLTPVGALEGRPGSPPGRRSHDARLLRPAVDLGADNVPRQRCEELRAARRQSPARDRRPRKRTARRAAAKRPGHACVRVRAVLPVGYAQRRARRCAGESNGACEESTSRDEESDLRTHALRVLSLSRAEIVRTPDRAASQRHRCCCSSAADRCSSHR